MNNEVIELVRLYVNATVSNNSTINKEAYELLSYMMRTDRQLAAALCDVYDQIVENDNGRYTVPAKGTDDEIVIEDEVV
jgi:hypothetical protein